MNKERYSRMDEDERKLRELYDEEGLSLSDLDINGPAEQMDPTQLNYDDQDINPLVQIIENKYNERE